MKEAHSPPTVTSSCHRTKTIIMIMVTVPASLCVLYNIWIGRLKDISPVVGSNRGLFGNKIEAITTEGYLEDVFKKRRDKLLKICKIHGMKWRGDGSVKRLVISQKYSLAFCPVPKIASTFWSNLILGNSLTDEPTDHHDKLDETASNKSSLHLRNLGFDLGYWYLKHYTSVLFVREPYSRLLAAYIDKFFTPNPLYWSLGKQIIKDIRTDPDAISLRCGQNVEFPEFIQHVIRDIKSGRADQHWKPIHQRCSPCQLEYNIIGKLENIESEGEYIIDKYLSEASFDDMKKETAEIRLKMNVDNFYRFFPTNVRYCMKFPLALKRLLRKLQIRGLIDKNIEYPNEWNLLFSVPLQDVKKFLIEAYRSTSKEALSNRREALIEAFSMVPLSDLQTIRELYTPDFTLFQYNPSPEYIFKIERRNVTRFYFTGV